MKKQSTKNSYLHEKYHVKQKTLNDSTTKENLASQTRNQKPKHDKKQNAHLPGQAKGTKDQPLNPRDYQRFAAIIIQVVGLWTQSEKEKYILGTLFFNQAHDCT